MSKKTVIITGAGSGLGRALAVKFAKEGWQLVLGDINTERLDETLILLRREGAHVVGSRCDVTKEQDLQSLVNLAEQEYGDYYAVINNAGIAGAGHLFDVDNAEVMRMLNVNLHAVIQACQVFMPSLIQKKSGHIVNVASVAAIAQAPGMAAYNISKAGVLALSESLRGDLAPHNVSVTVACPGFFKTNLLDSFNPEAANGREVAAEYMDKSKFTADDVANDIYAGMQKGKFLVISGRRERFLYHFKRFMPNLFARKVADMANRTA